MRISESKHVKQSATDQSQTDGMLGIKMKKFLIITTFILILLILNPGANAKSYVNKRALLVAGYNDNELIATEVYKDTLKEYYGFSEGNIQVFNYNEQGDSSITKFEKSFANIQKSSSEKDLTVIILDGHGYKYGDEAIDSIFYYSKNYIITGVYLIEQLNKIKGDKLIIDFSCFSGSLISSSERLNLKNTFIITSTDASSTCSQTGHGSFIIGFLADDLANSNGDVRKAFDNTVRRGSPFANPQKYDTINGDFTIFFNKNHKNYKKGYSLCGHWFSDKDVDNTGDNIIFECTDTCYSTDIKYFDSISSCTNYIKNMQLPIYKKVQGDTSVKFYLITTFKNKYAVCRKELSRDPKTISWSCQEKSSKCDGTFTKDFTSLESCKKYIENTKYSGYNKEAQVDGSVIFTYTGQASSKKWGVCRVVSNAIYWYCMEKTDPQCSQSEGSWTKEFTSKESCIKYIKDAKFSGYEKEFSETYVIFYKKQK